MIDGSRIAEFLADDLGIDMSDVEHDTPLFSSSIVDSFALVTLMMFLENEAGMRINPVDVTLDNFDTINLMVAFIERNSQ